jgi:hypothetical protein
MDKRHGEWPTRWRQASPNNATPRPEANKLNVFSVTIVADDNNYDLLPYTTVVTAEEVTATPWIAANCGRKESSYYDCAIDIGLEGEATDYRLTTIGPATGLVYAGSTDLTYTSA